MDYAALSFGDDAGRWFFVVMVADPGVLECRANVVFQLGTHLLISSLLNQQTTPELSCRSCRQIGLACVKKEAVIRGTASSV
jgi:hypothetical protein